MGDQPEAASTSVDAILAATRKVITERGPAHFTMSAIAATAGVSRPTLYRWFPTKEHLFSALSAYEEQQFDERLEAVINAQRSAARKLDAAVRFIVTYLDGHMGPDPIGADPGFAIQRLAFALQPQVQSLVRLLGDALDAVPGVQKGRLSRQQAAEILMRLAYSHYLVPSPDPEALLVSIRGFAGLSARSATVPA